MAHDMTGQSHYIQRNARLIPEVTPLPPAPKRYGPGVFWSAIAGAVILGLAGCMLWVLGGLRYVTYLNIDEYDLSSQQTLLSVQDRQKAEQWYNTGIQAYTRGQWAEAANNFAPLVQLVPSFQHNATAYLFLTYRSQGLSYLQNATTQTQAGAAFDNAIQLLSDHAVLLRSQFQADPRLLPRDLSDVEAMIADLSHQKEWLNLYTQGDAAEKRGDPANIATAIANWQQIYNENPYYLRQSQDAGRWVVRRLLAAYATQFNYYCSTAFQTQPALAALNNARALTVAMGLVDERTQIDTRLANTSANGCNGNPAPASTPQGGG